VPLVESTHTFIQSHGTAMMAPLVPVEAKVGKERREVLAAEEGTEVAAAWDSSSVYSNISN
jgi:hypothetical protein